MEWGGWGVLISIFKTEKCRTGISQRSTKTCDMAKLSWVVKPKRLRGGRRSGLGNNARHRSHRPAAPESLRGVIPRLT